MRLIVLHQLILDSGREREVMSTTIELEAGLFFAAESRARQEHRPVNNVVNQLLRTALSNPGSSPSTTSGQDAHFTIDSATGLPEVKGDRPLNSDDVARIDSGRFFSWK